MVKTCCVKNCDIDPKGNLTCFRFPNNRLLKRKWIDAIGLSNKLTANSTVCIKHFQEDDYNIVRGRPRLKAKVIPSVFCESDKKLPCITEDDLIANEIDTEITLKNLQKDKSHTSEGKTDKLENEGRKELHDENVAKVSKENGVELQNEGTTKIKVCNVKLQEVNVEFENTTPNDEVRTESDNEGKTKSQANTDVQIDKVDVPNEKVDVPNDKVDVPKDKVDVPKDKVHEGSTESKKEDSIKEYEVVQNNGKTKLNGIILRRKKVGKCYQDSFIESATKRATASEEVKDIEDILVNYQIKQTRPLPAERAPRSARSPHSPDHGPESLPENDPVFIEVAVQGDRAGSPRDCLMVLESVQVELDPSTFLDGEPDDCHETVDLADDDDDTQEQQDGNRRPDPISLLTSSDEDEVIIQEPHIDTVEVSDETDEDDVPLVKLLRKPKQEKDASIWNAYEYYCMDCQYTATNKQEYKAHIATHSTILQVCEICDYTTASKSQFSRHKRKHKEDRKFKCHLCDYKARHNMSLIYHLKSHRALSSVKKGFKCDKCGFKSDVKAAVLKHVKLCITNVKKYSCDKCVYETKRPSDLKRHKARRHRDDHDDDDDFVP